MAGMARDRGAAPSDGRSWGRMTRDRDTGRFDHACWGYSDERERADAAASWLAEGRRLGQRALYVADLPRDRLIDEIRAVPLAASSLVAGALVVFPSFVLYDLSAPIDPPAQLQVYADAVEDALSAGYTGLRVAADITPLVADPARRPAHLRWEQYAEHYIAEHPLAPMCLFDTRRVSEIDAIVCAHPLQGPREPSFALYGGGATTAALAGEVDALVAETLGEALSALPETDTEIDVSGLAFVDGRAAWTLQRELVERRANGHQMVLTHPTNMLRGVWHACAFDESLLAA